jgi:uncharacterized protein (DUF1786 family)
MSKYLMVDIGAGTMDILYYDESDPQHYKAVVPSPIRSTADLIRNTPGNLLLTGVEMGGGAISGLLKARAQQYDVVISASAAATLHHDLEKISAWGIQVVDDPTAENLKREDRYSHIHLTDLDMDRLNTIVTGFGVTFSFDAVAVCAQDHGVAPPGVSHLDFRHNMFTALLDKNPEPHVLLYPRDAVPENLNRLKSIAETAAAMPTREVYVMDSGMAAVLGASLDHGAKGRDTLMILDVATSHTLGASLVKGELAGFFEYHTSDITAGRLESLLKDLADGRLQHEQILAEGGHGAYTRMAVGFEAIEAIIATGPKRNIISASPLHLTWGAPMGDNMMTGTAGLLEALRRRKGLGAMPLL